MKDKITDALLKVALGFQVAEVTEEYAEVDGALKLTKRKRTFTFLSWTARPPQA